MVFEYGISAIFVVNMTYSQFINQACRRLSGLYPEREAKVMAARLLQHYCGISSYEHMIEPFGAIAPEVLPFLERAVLQLEQSCPLQYVIGWQMFCDLKIAVEEGVLIPRQETEELVMWVAEYVKSRGFLRHSQRPVDTQMGDWNDNSLKILDAASGSGCIACALASKFRQAQVFACDISDKALEITAKNFESCGCHNAKVFKCDLLSNAAYTLGQFLLRQVLIDHSLMKQSGFLDIIVSNPPYVTELEKLQMRPNVLDYEPQEALFVPDANPLLFYRALAELASEVLVQGGVIFMEINEQFASEIVALFSNEYFSYVQIRNDIFDKPRMVMAVKSIGYFRKAENTAVGTI